MLRLYKKFGGKVDFRHFCLFSIFEGKRRNCICDMPLRIKRWYYILERSVVSLMNINEEIIARLNMYSPRRLDIIFSEPEDLKQYPTENELKELLDLCNKLYDYDALSLINSKYDLSFLDKEDEIEIKVSTEEIEKAKQDFIAFMRQINPSFSLKSNNNE